MAKAIKQKRQKKLGIFPFERHNYVVIGLGLLSILAGYIALLEKTVEGFMPLYVAPILLVLGYCVLIPIGILVRKREVRLEAPPEQQPD
jgi:predicted Co/Zn/Cd cation transporter (cation efflux family)